MKPSLASKPDYCHKCRQLMPIPALQRKDVEVTRKGLEAIWLSPHTKPEQR